MIEWVTFIAQFIIVAKPIDMVIFLINPEFSFSVSQAFLFNDAEFVVDEEIERMSQSSAISQSIIQSIKQAID